MEPRSRVFELSEFFDDPRYEGFAEKPPATIPDTFPTKRTDRRWQMRRLARAWKPIEVVGRVRKFNDYPCCGGCPAFSGRTAEALGEFLEPNGELLPLKSPLGPYFLYNVTTVADVLDRKRSDVDWLVKGVTALRVERFEFHAPKLKGLSIFVTPEQPNTYVVTERFVARAQERGLQGMHFKLLWPLPAGTRWWDLAKLQGRRHKAEGLAAGRTIKGQTLVIHLRLADAGAKGTERERAAVLPLLDQLDALLFDPDSDRPATGSVEGHDFVPGQARIFLSGPDADELLPVLRPWLKKLKWPMGFTLTKRDGGVWDLDAREIRVE